MPRLAAPFVVTLSVLPACVHPGAPSDDISGTSVDDPRLKRLPDGTCYLNPWPECGGNCNPPAPRPFVVECPADLRGGAPASGPERPGWLRVGAPSFAVSGDLCQYTSDRWCHDPRVTTFTCEQAHRQRVACHELPEEVPAPGALAFIRIHPTAVASFVAPRADGTCLRYPAFRYIPLTSELPAGEPAPCPRVLAAQPLDAPNVASAGAPGAALEALAAKIPDARPLTPLMGATLAEGDRMELPVEVNAHCIAALATSDGVHELDLELVATDMFANMTPGGVLTHAAERGSAATIGVSTPCFKNPLPVPITAKLVVTAVEGGGPVVLRVVERRD